MKRAIYVFVAAILAVSVDGQVVKTNVFYDATLTLNLGLEFRAGGFSYADVRGASLQRHGLWRGHQLGLSRAYARTVGMGVLVGGGIRGVGLRQV